MTDSQQCLLLWLCSFVCSDIVCICLALMLLKSSSLHVEILYTHSFFQIWFKVTRMVECGPYILCCLFSTGFECAIQMGTSKRYFTRRLHSPRPAKFAEIGTKSPLCPGPQLMDMGQPTGFNLLCCIGGLTGTFWVRSTKHLVLGFVCNICLVPMLVNSC